VGGSSHWRRGARGSWGGVDGHSSKIDQVVRRVKITVLSSALLRRSKKKRPNRARPHTTPSVPLKTPGGIHPSTPSSQSHGLAPQQPSPNLRSTGLYIQPIASGDTSWPLPLAMSDPDPVVAVGLRRAQPAGSHSHATLGGLCQLDNQMPVGDHFWLQRLDASATYLPRREVAPVASVFVVGGWTLAAERSWGL
jgi:hypothetical protein